MIIESRFKAAKYLTNPHLQSMWPTLLMSRRPALKTRRERFVLPDNDFVDLEWYGPETGPIIILMHGVTGHINSAYIKYMMPKLAKQGWRTVMMYYRGYSGEHNRSDRMTHAGHTADFAEFIKYLHQREPETPLVAIGFSQGANMLLKYLGEANVTTPLRCAIAVSPPFQLRSISNRVRRGFARLYQWYLLRQLRKFYREKFRYRRAPFNTADLDSLRSFWNFDDKVTAPVNGFSNAVDYYRQASCEKYLKNIKIPTLIIHAIDDSIMTPDIIPTEKELSASTTLELSQHGGHLGFVSGSLFKPHFWLNERIPEYLSAFI